VRGGGEEGRDEEAKMGRRSGINVLGVDRCQEAF